MIYMEQYTDGLKLYEVDVSPYREAFYVYKK